MPTSIIDHTTHKTRPPSVKSRATGTKRRPAQDTLFKVLPAPVRRSLLRAYQQALNEPADDGITALVQNGRTFTAQERASLRAAALADSFALRRQILTDTLSSSQVARLLGTTRQTPLDRLQNGTLLALRDGGTWHFPAWQFDATGPDGIVPGLAEVLVALETNPFTKARWLLQPHPELDGQTPLAALGKGQVSRVIPLAVRLEAN